MFSFYESCVFFVREDAEPKNLARGFDIGHIISAFKSEPMFLRLLRPYFVNGAANALPAALFVFFVGHRLGTPQLAGPFLLVYFGSAIMATPLWLRLSRSVAKHRLWCYTMIYASMVFSFAIFVDSGDLIAFFLICLFGGTALSADLAIPASIQADLVDFETARGGQRLTGTFFSFWSIATKGSVALSSAFGLLILSFFNFNVAGDNTEISLLVLTGLYTLLPILLKICAIMLMWNFKLTKDYHQKVQASLFGNS